MSTVVEADGFDLDHHMSDVEEADEAGKGKMLRLDLGKRSFIDEAKFDWMPGPGESASSKFSDSLLEFCGNMTTAWRLYLDVDNKCFLTLLDMTQICKSIDPQMDGTMVFLGLDQARSGRLFLCDLSPYEAVLLSSFHGKLRARYGLVGSAVAKLGMNTPGRLLSEDEFVKAVVGKGGKGLLETKEAQALFPLLSCGRGAVSCQDFFWLSHISPSLSRLDEPLIPLPPEAPKKARAGSASPRQPSPRAKSPRNERPGAADTKSQLSASTFYVNSWLQDCFDGTVSPPMWPSDRSESTRLPMPPSASESPEWFQSAAAATMARLVTDEIGLAKLIQEDKLQKRRMDPLTPRKSVHRGSTMTGSMTATAGYF